MLPSIESGRKPDTKACPFCEGSVLRQEFVRDPHVFHRCLQCGADVCLHPQLQEEWAIYESGEFLKRIDNQGNGPPDFSKLREIQPYLVGNSLFEVGPGSGHLIAAAAARGYRVHGSELSPAHRRYIRKRWNIEVSDRTVEAGAIPESSFDNVVSFNCLEHVPDIGSHLRALVRVLRPGGRIVISTCNANSLVPRLVGRWWSMYGVPDHVCIATAEGLRRAGQLAGLRVLRSWSSEYPLETPMGVVVALRDWWRSRSYLEMPPKGISSGESFKESRARRIGRVLIANSAFSFVGNTIAYFGLGGTIKVVYEKPENEDQSSPRPDYSTVYS